MNLFTSFLVHANIPKNWGDYIQCQRSWFVRSMIASFSPTSVICRLPRIRRTVSHTRPAFLKMPWAPLAFLPKRPPQAPGDKPSPSGEGYCLEGRPPEAHRRRSYHTWHECRLLGIHVRHPRPTATETKTHATWSVYRKNTTDRNLSQPSGPNCNEIQFLSDLLPPTQMPAIIIS